VLDADEMTCVRSIVFLTGIVALASRRVKKERGSFVSNIQDLDTSASNSMAPDRPLQPGDSVRITKNTHKRPWKKSDEEVEGKIEKVKSGSSMLFSKPYWVKIGDKFRWYGEDALQRLTDHATDIIDSELENAHGVARDAFNGVVNDASDVVNDAHDVVKDVIKDKTPKAPVAISQCCSWSTTSSRKIVSWSASGTCGTGPRGGALMGKFQPPVRECMTKFSHDMPDASIALHCKGKKACICTAYCKQSL